MKYLILLLLSSICFGASVPGTKHPVETIAELCVGSDTKQDCQKSLAKCLAATKSAYKLAWAACDPLKPFPCRDEKGGDGKTDHDILLECVSQ